uniref:Excinuclease ABC subunit B n=1 Tax=Chromera velia CCMP2878 TaxID=1169474 RepID=A0A0G4F0M2_9ALVE|eukprot:Cvel_14500.t1-p1 / transcript=Cvel_14500.t1 / gene=Cvel_14500 / organism=Chromera_velia_CCMP2878 / gene_product=UvrABC system protein B, putative / transcript_product=UvrABC system protein B, putative / location=Cvel_scaffold1034:16915-26030(+) / protein_length=1586 / sequence_SO=supercontig / SO=protein_coding / is_pseudo=false
MRVSLLCVAMALPLNSYAFLPARLSALKKGGWRRRVASSSLFSGALSEGDGLLTEETANSVTPLQKMKACGRTAPPADEEGFQVASPFPLSSEQERAVSEVCERLGGGDRFQVLRGATGTGKTFVMAHTISRLRRPTLVLCHNKTLAAQLVRELKGFLPDAAVELFVSYFDYYTPEHFNPRTKQFREKKSQINAELDAMRHRATRALFERKDVVIVSSVSCLYGLGLPSAYLHSTVMLSKGQELEPSGLKSRLKEILYEERKFVLRRKALQTESDTEGDEDEDEDEEEEEEETEEEGKRRDVSSESMNSERKKKLGMERGTFAIRENSQGSWTDVAVWPPYERLPLVFRFFRGELVSILPWLKVAREIGLHNVKGEEEGEKETEEEEMERVKIYPAKHFVYNRDRFSEALRGIKSELAEREQELFKDGQFQAAMRLRERTERDLSLMRETGFCKGMENYSRHMSGRAPGEAPDTLLDYMKFQVERERLEEKGEADGGDLSSGWLLIADESHMSLPQVRTMYEGDKRRKSLLVKEGFRLPSAFDHRPLSAKEFWERVDSALFVSATPAPEELAVSAKHCRGPPAVFRGQELVSAGGNVVEMILRPTHVVDPPVEVLPREGQLSRLVDEIAIEKSRGGRVLCLAMTQRDAETLSQWLVAKGIRADYLHCKLTTPKRSEVLRKLQEGKLDVLVGVNLLREGLDLPEVSLVAVLDADKEGFLRSDRALIQGVGRAARNAEGRAIFFADRVSESMRRCMKETARRREIQMRFNARNGAVPKSTRGREIKSVFDIAREEIGEEGGLEKEALWAQRRRGSDGEEADIPGSLQQLSTPGSPPTPEFDLFDHLRHLVGLREQAADLPDSPGVYLWKDGPGKDAEVLYVGKAKDVRKRVKSYFRPPSTPADASSEAAALASLSPRLFAMLRRARHIEVERTGTEHEALLLEAALIKKLQPAYNVLLRDDSFYPYLCVDWTARPPLVDARPRDGTARGGKGAGGTGGKERSGKHYYGPFTSPRELRGVLENIEKAFGLREKRLMAKYSEMDKAEYADAVSALETVLQGHDAPSKWRNFSEEDGRGEAHAERLAAFRELRRVFGGRGDGSGLLRPPVGASWDAVGVGAATLPALEGEEDGGVGTEESLVKRSRHLLTVHILQVRDGQLSGRETYAEPLTTSQPRDASEESGKESAALPAADVEEAVCRILQRHYLSQGGEEPDQFPSAILFSPDGTRGSGPVISKEGRESLQSLLAELNKERGNVKAPKVSVRVTTKSGRRKGAIEEKKAAAVAQAHATSEALRLAASQEASGVLQLKEQTHQLQALFGLPHPPKRVEAFDISHTAGDETMASRVVFIDGVPSKKHYRVYRIRTLQPGQIDDYSAITEVMARRFRRRGMEEGDEIPDVVLIDGGKGQLSAALKGMEQAGVPHVPFVSENDKDKGGTEKTTPKAQSQTQRPFVCSLAKRLEEVFVPGRSIPVAVGLTEAGGERDGAWSEGLRLLRRARDECHRFALKAHRSRRTKKAGVGTKKSVQELKRDKAGLRTISKSSSRKQTKAVQTQTKPRLRASFRKETVHPGAISVNKDNVRKRKKAVPVT